MIVTYLYSYSTTFRLKTFEYLNFTPLPCHLSSGHLKYLFRSPLYLLSRYGVTRILNRMVVDKDFYSWNACKYHYLHHCCFHIWNYFHGSFLLLKTYFTKNYNQCKNNQIFSTVEVLATKFLFSYL